MLGEVEANVSELDRMTIIIWILYYIYTGLNIKEGLPASPWLADSPTRQPNLLVQWSYMATTFSELKFTEYTWCWRSEFMSKQTCEKKLELSIKLERSVLIQ